MKNKQKITNLTLIRTTIVVLCILIFVLIELIIWNQMDTAQKLKLMETRIEMMERIYEAK